MIRRSSCGWTGCRFTTGHPPLHEGLSTGTSVGFLRWIISRIPTIAHLMSNLVILLFYKLVLNLRSSCFQLSRMCRFQVKRCSKWISKQLVSVLIVMAALLMLTGRETVVLVVNVTWADFLLYRLSFHCCIHAPRTFRCSCRLLHPNLYVRIE